jgi:hypothetical protein
MVMLSIIAEAARHAAQVRVKTCEIGIPALPEVIPERILYRFCNALLRYTARPALVLFVRSSLIARVKKRPSLAALELFVRSSVIAKIKKRPSMAALWSGWCDHP